MEEGKFLSISFQSASLSSEVLGRVGYYLWCLMSMVLLSLPNYCPLRFIVKQRNLLLLAGVV
jgi:hypothetical protein